MKGRTILGLAVGLVLLAGLSGATTARADEIRLKDGTKITGTIVGFENDSFKVETAYGSAVIRKDMVADIIVSAPKKEPEPKATKTAPPAPQKAPSDVSAAKQPAAASPAVALANPPATTPAMSATASAALPPHLPLHRKFR